MGSSRYHAGEGVAAVRAVPRDLFPLPRCDPSVGRPSVCSRPVAQRARRRQQCLENVNEVVWALNELAGCGQSFEGLRPSSSQTFSLEGIEEAVRNDIPPPSMPTPEAALCELLGNRSTGYSDPSAPLSLAPFCLDQISWPTCAGSACLVESLPESDRSVLTDVVNQLLLPAP